MINKPKMSKIHTCKKQHKNNDRIIFGELHEIMNLFRTIFVDDKSICNCIDDNYEIVLINDMRLIPEQYDEMILKYIRVLKVILKHVNFSAIHDELTEIGKIDPSMMNFSLMIDSYSLVEQGITKLNIPRTDKLKMSNIMTKLRPLFACVDKVFLSPMSTLKSISELGDMNKYDDLL